MFKTLVGCLILGIFGDYTTQLYGEYLISQYKDPYKPICMMECHKGFERCSSDYLVGFRSVSSNVWALHEPKTSATQTLGWETGNTVRWCAGELHCWSFFIPKCLRFFTIGHSLPFWMNAPLQFKAQKLRTAVDFHRPLSDKMSELETGDWIHANANSSRRKPLVFLQLTCSKLDICWFTGITNAFVTWIGKNKRMEQKSSPDCWFCWAFFHTLVG